ncbi:DUF3352 domain-containing protein, partial [Planctomycetota bacterium]
LYYGWVGTRLAIVANDEGGRLLMALQGESRGSEHFWPGMSDNGDALAFFLDWGHVRPFIRSLLKETEDSHKELACLPVLMETLGLNQMQHVAARCGYVKQGLEINERVSLSGPRQGLWKLMQPADRTLFRYADARAIDAQIWHWDVGGTFDLVMEVLQKVSTEHQEKVRQALAQMETNTGVALQKDVLANLSGAMMMYSLPQGVHTDVPAGGAVFTAKVKDANAFETAMQKIGEFVQTRAQGQLQIGSQESDAGTLHTWTVSALLMAQVMPTWTVIDNTFILATNMPLCSQAMTLRSDTAAQETALASTEVFKQATQGVPNGALWIGYEDTQTQYREMSKGIQRLWPMAVMMAMQKGVQLPFILPNVDHLLTDVKPSCSYSWFDEKGLQSHVEGASSEMAIVGGAVGGLMGGIMMPALVRARLLANRMQSGKHLAGIGKAALIYANDNDDVLPPDLETLVQKDYLDEKFLTSPLCEKDGEGPDYIYVAKQTAADDPQNVLAYDNPNRCKDKDGVNVLFIDSHVAFVKYKDLDKHLKETYERLGDRAPKESN